MSGRKGLSRWIFTLLALLLSPLQVLASDTSSIAIATFHPKKGAESQFLSMWQDHAAHLLAASMITSRPVLRMQSTSGAYVQIFEWASQATMARAHEDATLHEMWERLKTVSDYGYAGIFSSLPECLTPGAMFATLDGPTWIGIEAFQARIEDKSRAEALLQDYVRALRATGYITAASPFLLQSQEDRACLLMAVEWTDAGARERSQSDAIALNLRKALEEVARPLALADLPERSDRFPNFRPLDRIETHLRLPVPLVDSFTLQPRDGYSTTEIVSLVRDHWAALRARNLAAAYPILILMDDADVVRYVFQWQDPASWERAAHDAFLTTMMQTIEARAAVTGQRGLRQVHQGFDFAGFPAAGGVELLKGKCASVVQPTGSDERVTVNVANGFVLMHRSPGHDTDADGNREMYIDILQHGGDIDLDLEGPVASGIKILRVEQNQNLPQYGLVRALTPDRDFPATAMWVVHWRILTNVGALITDPQTPLVFGPTTVEHYPPVGTEFTSSTGPVRLLHEATGQVVAMLTPQELTAFDIVVTKDDEIDSIALNDAPRELVALFNERTRPQPSSPAAGTNGSDEEER